MHPKRNEYIRIGNQAVSKDLDHGEYSEVPIKSTVLLRILFEYFQSISIKSTINWEIGTKKA